ncbi:hypothetical protein [Aeromicrobium alkaliterrae]|uniref:MFS transporter n=1 Tax=Aeromicrobium alkaliterrae TaxID=302168 RepID=A0ABP4WAK8_9ACTN
MTSTHVPSTSDRTQILPWAVLGAALLQVVAPLVTLLGPGTSPGGGSGPDLLITPVGWAFSIWGVIYTLAIAQAVAELRAGTTGSSPRRQVAQVVLYVGGAVWIGLAGLDSSVATAAALLVMAGAALVAVVAVVREPLAPRWFSLLTRASVGLYAGWVTAALFLNLSTAAVDVAGLDAGRASWQIAVLVVAAVTLVGFTVVTGGTLGYVLAGVWALFGITVTARSDGSDAIASAAVAGAVALAAAALVTRLTAPRSPARS